MDKKIIIPTFIIITVFWLSFYFWQGIYWPKDPVSQKESIFLIQKGQGAKEIAENLKRENLIRCALCFRIYVLFKGFATKLQTGRYLLSPSMTIPEIAEKFVLGKVVKEKITIIEGWNLKDIAVFFEERGICQEEEFLEISKRDFSDQFEFLKDKPKELSLEGYLFPDTYYINTTFSTIVENVSLTKLENIVKKMLKNFDKKLTPELRKEIQKQGKTIFEIITMASMLEKEVKSFEDKKLVSGILWKRLKNNMPLQVDATITYITGKKTTKIPKEDLEIDSPYNTYKYRGLPLGPISNPGLESIMAAIYPKESEYWYYLSTPDGKTIFSKTLQEHNLAKAKYLK